MRTATAVLALLATARAKTLVMRPVGLLLLLDSARQASSHASYMTSSYCSTSLSAGTTIMNSAAVSSSDRTVSFDEASCGDEPFARAGRAEGTRAASHEGGARQSA